MTGFRAVQGSEVGLTLKCGLLDATVCMHTKRSCHYAIIAEFSRCLVDSSEFTQMPLLRPSILQFK